MKSEAVKLLLFSVQRQSRDDMFWPSHCLLVALVFKLQGRHNYASEYVSNTGHVANAVQVYA